ncbi:MAG: sulfide/dihydroorotate dehydrogenase-like FAD/NAD-binding protein [Lachnospiraceae bacterium]|nr:sulfide/dihydroorotate dehydrogenase-like FAD/NAD-binding protein [Lachnospiraceae bacterium]
MYKIIKKRNLAYKLCLYEIENERLARVAMPGQFLIVKIDDKGERIPLTICDYDRDAGTVTIVVQEVGATTKKMNELNVGDYLQDVVGPLGNESDLISMNKDELKDKKIVFIAGGLGSAPVYPQAKYLSSQGIDFDVILGYKNKDVLILEKEYRDLKCNLYVCTDDESYGFKGPVTNVLKLLCSGKIADADYKDTNGKVVKGKEVIKSSDKKKYNHAVAIGSAVMMKFACITTKELGIPTVVSMNTLMVDGTGMCGACRLMVGDDLKFCCIDGPEFDGHKIDFDSVIKRQAQYKDEESRALLKLNEGNTHHGGCGNCGG